MPLIFLGPPGAGKGTQAEILAQQGPIPHISTGDILRKAIAGSGRRSLITGSGGLRPIASETPLGIQAQAHLDQGELIPDNLIMAMMRERLSQSDTKLGWILDGFPRTVSQARGLDQLLSILNQPHPQVVYFYVDPNVLVKRLLARGRKDDNEDTIRRRLEVYEAQTIPLIDFYQRRKCLISINGNLSVPEVTNNLYLALQFPVSA